MFRFTHFPLITIFRLGQIFGISSSNVVSLATLEYSKQQFHHRMQRLLCFRSRMNAIHLKFFADEFDFVCLEDCHQETHFPLSSFVDEARSRRKNVTQFGEAINYFCEILTLYTKSLFNFHSIFVAQKPIRFPTWTKNPAAMSAFCCTHSHSRIKAKCVTSESVIRK